MLQGMDLFENSINGNAKYCRPPPHILPDIVIPELEEDPIVSEDVTDIDVSILPRNSVEVST